MLAFDSANSIAYSEVALKPYQALGCDFIVFQETRRGWLLFFVAAEYTVYCFGDTSGAMGKSGHHRVGIAVKGSILEETGETGVVADCISDRFMKVRLELKRKIQRGCFCNCV